MPSIWELFGITYALALAYVNYIIRFGSWDDVLAQWYKWEAWWVRLKDHIKAQASWYAGQAQVFLQGLINGISASLTSAWTHINDINTWITDTALAAVNLVSVYTNELTTLVALMYTWLHSFWLAPVTTVKGWLGSAWNWLVWFKTDPAGKVRAWLGSAWNWLVGFYNNKYSTITGILGTIWHWLVWFRDNPVGIIKSWLGSAWNWLVGFYNNKYSTITGILGAAWTYVRSLFNLRGYGLVAFITSALGYWYSVWTNFRPVLSAFLVDPTGYILAAIREKFLDFLEDWLVEIW